MLTSATKERESFMFPTQGRIVHFYPNGLGAIGGTAINEEPMAAIVAFDNREKTGKLNLSVIDHEGIPFATSAVFVDDGEAVPPLCSECYCRWPVRVGVEDSSVTAGEPHTQQQDDEETTTTDGSGDVEASSTEAATPGVDQGADAGVDVSETVATASS